MCGERKYGGGVSRAGNYAQRTNITADPILAPGRGYVTVDLSTHLGWKDKPFGVVWANSPYTDEKPLILDSPDALLTQWKSPDLKVFDRRQLAWQAMSRVPRRCR